MVRTHKRSKARVVFFGMNPHYTKIDRETLKRINRLPDVSTLVEMLKDAGTFRMPWGLVRDWLNDHDIDVNLTWCERLYVVYVH